MSDARAVRLLWEEGLTTGTRSNTIPSLLFCLLSRIAETYKRPLHVSEASRQRPKESPCKV